MQKPEYIASCGFGSYVHLLRPAAIATPDNAITKVFCQSRRAIRTRAVDYNYLCTMGSLAQIRKK
jgi:hypothetical protein